MKLGELFVELAAKVNNPQAITGFKKSIDGLAKDLRNVSIAFTAAVYGMDKFISSTTNGVASLESLAAQTGLSADELQRWGKAASLANLNLNAESAMQSIAGLEKSLATLRVTGQGMGDFMRLGIDPTGKNAFDVLESLRDRLQNYDAATASYLLGQIGISPEFVSVLKLSREEFDKLGRSYFLSKKGREAILNTGRAIADMKMRLVSLKDQAVLKLSPIFLKLANDLLGWINKNQKKITDFIAWVAKLIADFSKAVGRAIGLTADFVENTLGLANGLKAIAVILGAITLRNSLLGRLFLIVGLLDDIAVWKAGGEAMFGDIYNWIKKIIDALSFLKNIFPSDKELSSKKEPTLLDSVNKEIMDAFKITGTGAAAGFVTGGPAGAFLGAQIGLTAGILKGIYDLFAENEDYQKMVAEGEARRSGIIQERRSQINNTQNNRIEVNVMGVADRNTANDIARQVQNALATTGNGVR